MNTRLALFRSYVIQDFIFQFRSCVHFYHYNHFFTLLAEAAVCRCSSKKMLLKFRNIHRKTHVLESIFNKETLLEKDSQVFSCEYYEVFKNTFFYRTPPVAASTLDRNFTVAIKNKILHSIFIWSHKLKSATVLTRSTEGPSRI